MGAYVHEGPPDRRIAALDAVGHRRLTQRGWWLAAVRAIGPGAVLSHADAGALWNLRGPPGGRVNVTVVSRGRRQRKGIRVHSVSALPPEHVTTHDRIPVTTAARTLADLACAVERPALARALEAAEALQLLDVPHLLQLTAGRPGARTVQELLERALPHTRSEFEAALGALCDDYGIPRPLMNTTVAGYEVDAYRQVTTRRAWVASRLAPRSRHGSSSSRRSAA